MRNVSYSVGARCACHRETCELRGCHDAISLSRSFLPARHSALIVVILNYVNRAALLWVALDDGEGAIRTESLDHFGPTIEIIITNLARQHAVRVLLHEIYFAVEIPVTLDPDYLIVAERPHYIGLAVAIGIDRQLILIRTDSDHPLIGAAVGAAMSNGRTWRFRAGESRER
jgi:hypothetical protein